MIPIKQIRDYFVFRFLTNVTFLIEKNPTIMQECEFKAIQGKV